jgi:hypothetical protein
MPAVPAGGARLPVGFAADDVLHLACLGRRGPGDPARGADFRSGRADDGSRHQGSGPSRTSCSTRAHAARSLRQTALHSALRSRRTVPSVLSRIAAPRSWGRTLKVISPPPIGGTPRCRRLSPGPAPRRRSPGPRRPGPGSPRTGLARSETARPQADVPHRVSRPPGARSATAQDVIIARMPGIRRGGGASRSASCVCVPREPDIPTS